MVGATLAVRAPFEYDEAVYAAKSRAWTSDTPAVAWIPSRAPALPALGSIAMRLGARDDLALRLLGLGGGIAALIATWLLARALFGPGVAAAAAATVASAPTIVTRAAQFLTDLPAVALLLLTMLFVWRGLERDDRGSLILAAAFASAAFYTRYPSIVGVAAIVAAGWAAFGRRALRRDAAIALGLFVVALVPHFVWATRELGAPWSAISFAHGFARSVFGEGLVEYVRALPAGLAGPLAGAVMIAGLVGFGMSARRRADTPRKRASRFLGVAAVVQIVGLGLPNYGQPRFVFFAVAVLCIAGVATLAPMLSRVRARAGIVLCVFAVAFAGAGLHATARARVARDDRAVLRAAGIAVSGDARGPCTVIAARRPEIAWYSGCFAIATAGDRLPDGDWYFVDLPRFPDPGVSSGVDTVLIARIDDVGTRFGSAVVYRSRR